MTEAIRHRGPDAMGYYQSGAVAFGHCRLAVIDLAASLQPMISKDRRHVLVYNGELYNFRELRSELQALGCIFQTGGDTEVVLQALAQWGEAALPRMQGMFAFAFWDEKEKSLLLARDHVGVKPLHISWDGHRLLFASEIKALLEHPSLPREIDPHALGLYLECQYIPAPFSMYRHIRKVLPAHYIKLKNGYLEERRYWNPSYLPKFDFNEEEGIELLERELRRSVKSMLVADVPLGAFISGGIDSSVIASLMQQKSGKKIKLFHLGLDNAEHGEQKHAARVASFLDAEYYPLIASPRDVLNTLGHLVEAFDEPFGDQAALPTLLLSELSRRHVTVVLSGEGADEIFAGYSNYAKRLKEATLSATWGGKYSPLRWIYPFLPTKLRKNRLVKSAARPIERRYTTIPNLFDRETHASLFSPEFYALQGTGLEDLAASHYASCDSTEYLDKMLHIDTNLWLPDDLLTKMDRASMFHSLEARVPYLDHHFVEFAARLPTSFKLNGRNGKYLLKRLAEKKGLLPPEIIHRSKQGFSLPLREWLTGDLKPLLDDALSSNGLLGRNIFRKGVIEQLRKEEANKRRFHATRLWSLLILELWFRKYAPDYRCT